MTVVRLLELRRTNSDENQVKSMSYANAWFAYTLIFTWCWYLKRFENCCSKSSSIECSKRLKFYWFCVLLWYKNQCWANTENVQIWQHFLCWDFLNRWMETSPEREVFKSTVRQDDLRNHEFKVAQQDQHNLALSYVSKIFNYQQPWSLVNPPNPLLLLQLSS